MKEMKKGETREGFASLQRAWMHAADLAPTKQIMVQDRKSQ